MTGAAIAEIGDNQPPQPMTAAEALRDRLAENFADQIARRDELLAGAVPVVIETEAEAENLTEFLKQIRIAFQLADATHKTEKSGFLESGRVVDAFFKHGIYDPLKKYYDTVDRPLTAYQQKKEAEERRIRLEEERVAREKAAAAQAEADRIAAEEAAAATLATSIEAVTAVDRAEGTQADAVVATKRAAAPAAELSRTRGQYGATSSLTTKWVFEITALDKIPLAPLRQHIHREAIEKAVRSYVRAGGRELKGVRIYEHTRSVVR